MDHAVLGTADKATVHYAVPITPWVYNGKIYFHGAGADTGRRANNLKQNPIAMLTYVTKEKTNIPNLSVDYVSVMVQEPVNLITDKEEKKALLKEL